MLGKHVDPDRLAALRHDLGYDRPIYVRFWDYLQNLLQFEFGRSRLYKTDISEMILRGAIPSLTVTLPSFLIATCIAVSLSLLCASYRGGTLDRTLLLTAVALMSVSALVYIIFGQYLFSYLLEWVPVGGFEYGPSMITYIALPIGISIVLSIAPDLRFYRTAMLEEVKQDYVRTARSKGVSESKVLFVHILRNAMIPILTRVVVVLPFLFTGSLLIEQFFGIPGLGFMVVNGALNNDMPVIRAMTFISAVVYVIANLLTDIMYSLVDPRVRLS
jgi:peptide/nickel transport system permease protein